jgi:hypothetical protein
MPCLISDVAVQLGADGKPLPRGGQRISFAPSFKPLFVSTGGPFRELSIQSTNTVSDGVTGAWSLSLPRPSESDPNTVVWTYFGPDGVELAGQVPEIDGPVSLHDLKETYGWGVVQPPAGPPVLAIVGPPGPQGLSARDYRDASGVASGSSQLELDLYMPPVNSVAKVTVRVTAVRLSDGAANGWMLSGTVKNIGGVVSTAANFQLTMPPDVDPSPWSVDVQVVGGVLAVLFTGDSGAIIVRASANLTEAS